jgi:Ca-activated chloride channel family protein
MLSGSVRKEAIRRIVVLTDGHANAGVTGREQLSALMGQGKIANVTTSFIGFSTGYDEELLEALALAGLGNNYYCEGPDQASAVFIEEFQGLASVVAQNISVEVAPTSVVASCQVLHEFPVVMLPGGGAQIEIGDAYGRECRRVVLGFNLRPLQHEGKVDIASITIRWTTATGNLEMHAVTMPVSVIAGQSGVVDTGADPRVRDEVLVLKVAQSRKEAQLLADSGDFDRAADVLEQAKKEIELLPALTAEVQQLEIDVERLRHRLWDLKDKKMNFARSQELRRKRKAQFIDEMGQQDKLGKGTDHDDDEDRK